MGLIHVCMYTDLGSSCNLGQGEFIFWASLLALQQTSFNFVPLPLVNWPPSHLVANLPIVCISASKRLFPLHLMKEIFIKWVLPWEQFPFIKTCMWRFSSIKTLFRLLWQLHPSNISIVVTIKMTVRGTMVRSEVCNSWCFCLESQIQHQHQHKD